MDGDAVTLADLRRKKDIIAKCALRSDHQPLLELRSPRPGVAWAAILHLEADYVAEDEETNLCAATERKAVSACGGGWELQATSWPFARALQVALEAGARYRGGLALHAARRCLAASAAAERAASHATHGQTVAARQSLTEGLHCMLQAHAVHLDGRFSQSVRGTGAE
eukprot:SAG31_NODE_974_length_10627_cov_11.246201_12_plen_168_part_00